MSRFQNGFILSTGKTKRIHRVLTRQIIAAESGCHHRFIIGLKGQIINSLSDCSDKD
jgi:hypothetical protein